MLADLPTRDRALVGVYVAAALAALVATQWALIEHFRGGGDLSSFLTDPFVNPAATFLTLDALIVAFAALVFMIVEGRRLGMRWLWVYVVLVFAVAVSVAFPLFLAARHLTVARRGAANALVD